MNTEVTPHVAESASATAPSSKNLPVREPRYSIREQARHFAVEVELPGVAKEGIHMEQKGDELMVTAERPDDVGEGWTVHLRRSGALKYRLNLRLGHAVDHEAVQAAYADGLLRLAVGKRGAAADRVITIQ